MYCVRKHFFNQFLKEFDLVTLPKKDKNHIWSLSAVPRHYCSKFRQSIETQIDSERQRANVDAMILSILGYFTV